MQVSYQQAGLVCYFAAQRWGFQRLASMLRSFDGKVTTADAIRKVFEVSPEEFDKQFNAFMRERYAAYIADPKRWPDLMERAHRMLDRAATGRRRATPRRRPSPCSRISPPAAAPTKCWPTAEDGAGNPAAAIAALQSLAQGRRLGSHRACASWPRCCWTRRKMPRPPRCWRRSTTRDPLVTEGHDQLGQLLLAQSKGADGAAGIPGAAEAAAAGHRHGQLRRSPARYRMTGDAKQARRHLLESLETAPNYRPAQHLLLEMTGEKAQ